MVIIAIDVMRFRKIIIISIISAILLSPLAVILPAPKVSADAAEDSLLKAATAWTALNYLNKRHVTDDGKLPQEWVDNVGYVAGKGCMSTGGDASSLAVGFLVANENGYLIRDTGMLCDTGTGTDIKPAFFSVYSSLGYDNKSFIEALGWKKQSDGSYHDGNFDSNTLNSVINKVWLPSLGSPNIGGPVPDWIKYLDSVTAAKKVPCTAAGLTEFPDDNGNSWIYGGGTVKRYKVTPTDTAHWLDAKFGLATTRRASCNDIMGELGQNGKLANAYKAALDKAKPDTPKTCEQKFAGKTGELKACIDGFKHQTDQTYCTKTYPSSGVETDKKINEACKYGQSTASGAEGVTREDPNAKGDQEKSTCNIEGIGWIVCPVMNFMAKLSDRAFTFLANYFLETKNNIVKDPQTEKAWSAMRDIANVIFVIAFLYIIYSQITGVGIGNYGIKKMLPKLIVVAILVNLSLFLCQVMVDVSNILGYSVKGFFNSLSHTVTVGGSGDNLAEATDGFGTTETVAAILIAGIGVALVLASGVLPLALIALFIIVMILMARMAAILILIVISPLAFAAYLLPNTEQWFKKWWDMFFKLLMVFPIIAFVFGGSQLASYIINNSAGNDNTLKIVALGVATLPFVAVPSLLKGAMAATGAIGAKMQGMADRTTRGASKRAARGMKERYSNSSFAQGRAMRKEGKKIFRQQRLANAISGNDTSATGRLRRAAAMGAPGILAGTRDARAGMQDRAESAANKAFEEDVAAADRRQQSLTSAERMTLARGGEGISEQDQMAAIRHVMKTGNFEDRRGLYTQSAKMGARQRAALSQGYYASGDNNVFGAGLGDRFIEGDVNEESLNEAAQTQINNGSVTASTLARDHRTAGYMATQAASPNVTDAGRARLSSEATRAQTDEKLNQNQNLEHGNALASLREMSRVQDINEAHTQAIQEEHRRNTPANSSSQQRQSSNGATGWSTSAQQQSGNLSIPHKGVNPAPSSQNSAAPAATAPEAASPTTPTPPKTNYSDIGDLVGVGSDGRARHVAGQQGVKKDGSTGNIGGQFITNQQADLIRAHQDQIRDNLPPRQSGE